MPKIYILSKESDKDISETIHNMPESQLRVALYGVARGWNFDEAVAIAKGAQMNPIPPIPTDADDDEHTEPDESPMPLDGDDEEGL